MRISDLNKDGTFDLSKLVEGDANIYNNSQKLQVGDIVVVVTGATIGKVGVWNSPEECYLGGDLIKFSSRLLNSTYVYTYLKSRFGQLQIERNITGATNGHLSPLDIEQFLIPLPPLPIQQKIADEVEKRRAEAFGLQAEAKQILEKVKEDFEGEVLGKN